MKRVRKRGDIWYCDLEDAIGSEQQFRRPVLVVQVNELNRGSPTTIIVPITSQLKYPFMQAHHVLEECNPLQEPSMALTEQVRAVDKSRLNNRVGRLKAGDMLAVEEALRWSFGLCA